MAKLMKCGDCGTAMSKKAAACPACGATRGSNGVAAILSILIPGFGQVYKGHLFNGFLWFALVVAGYCAFIVPGLILHLICIIGAMSGTKGGSSTGLVAKASIAAVFLVVAIVWIGGRSGPRRGDNNSPPPASPTTSVAAVESVVPPKMRPISGRVYVNRPGPSGDVHLVVDLASSERLRRAIEAKTLGDFTQMRESGALQIVPNGTMAELLEDSANARKIRLVNGELAGSEGWVFREYLQPNPVKPGVAALMPSDAGMLKIGDEVNAAEPDPKKQILWLVATVEDVADLVATESQIAGRSVPRAGEARAKMVRDKRAIPVSKTVRFKVLDVRPGLRQIEAIDGKGSEKGAKGWVLETKLQSAP